MQENEEDTLIRESIQGARTFGNLITFFILAIAGNCFSLAGISSYLGKNLLPFTDTSEILFLPQGITMLFYGTGALGIGVYLLITMVWNIGSGYNEFSKVDKIVRIIRLGFPGKNQRIFLSYEFQTIERLKYTLKQGINPRCNILLILKDKREIPLFPAQSFLEPVSLEKKAVRWAKFLNVPLTSIVL